METECACMMRFSSIFVENLLRLMISLVDSMQKHVMHVHKCHMACISASHISHMACISDASHISHMACIRASHVSQKAFI